MHKLTFLLVAVVLALSGCGGGEKVTEESLAGVPQPVREGLPEPSGGVVLAVNGETITAEEIIAPLSNHFSGFAKAADLALFRSAVRPQVEKFLADRVYEVLLYQQAKKTAGEQIEQQLDKAADKEVRNFVVGFGGDYAKAQDALQAQGMNWDDFRKWKKKMIMSQSYLQQKMPESKPVTYTDLVEYYNQIKDAEFAREAKIQFSLIDVMPAKIEAAEGQTAEAAARKLAQEVVQRAKAGEDFAELAKKYSHGHTAAYGGLWKKLSPDSLAAPYDRLAEAAEGMRPGDIAGPIEAGEHIFIMKLEDKQTGGYMPFEDVQRDVEARLKLDRQRKAWEEATHRIFRQASLGDRDQFVDFCVDQVYWRGRARPDEGAVEG
jgi:peptidyl-prolyl cis-trans isomerase SurA